jgi:glucokinase
LYGIGVDLGGTKICTGVVNESGKLLFSTEVSTDARDGLTAVLGRIFSTIEYVMQRVDRRQFLGIGIAAPGPLDYHKGELLSPPNLPGWDAVPLRDIVSERFGLPTYLDNDANAATVAEHLFGAGERADNMVYVTVSTGIGAGLVMDGRLRRGHTGSAAEVGHMIVQQDGPKCNCGNKGCLEAVASGTGIARRAKEVYGKELSAKEVVTLANQGDGAAEKILDDAFHALGIGMVNVVNLFDPSVIVIGGGLSQIGDMLFEPVRLEVANNRFRGTAASKVRVVPARLGTKAGVIGAGVLPMLSQIYGDGSVNR